MLKTSLQSSWTFVRNVWAGIYLFLSNGLQIEKRRKVINHNFYIINHSFYILLYQVQYNFSTNNDYANSAWQLVATWVINLQSLDKDHM